MTRDPALLGLLAGIVTWAFTTLGAAAVFLSKEFSRRSMDVALGFAGGVMLSAAIFSLLAPSLEIAAESWGSWRFIPAACGVFIGAALLRGLDYALPHLHPVTNTPDGPKNSLPKSFLLILAITLHNIPEALAVGVAFGAVAIDPDLAFTGAVVLTLGIGVQNLPEGMAVSLPLAREGFGKKRAFFYGQLSGIVEPVAAVAGALLASIAKPFLPWALGIAAGAMIFVTVEEVIPESQGSGNGDLATIGLIIGFVCMMCLDVAFG